MTHATSIRLYKIISAALLALLIYTLIKKRRQELSLKSEKEEGKSFQEIAPLDKLDSKNRAFFEQLRDTVYESERWAALLPELELNPNWTIQPCPPIESEVLRFKVWNKPHDAPAIVAFDPYWDAENPVWKVFADDTEIYDVPIDDTKQLRAVIASVLQEVSPVKP